MPLSICDSSQKKRQAVQEEREKKRRRRSLPLTIESTTSVNPEKVHKRRLSRRLSKSDLLNNVSAQKADGPEQPVRRNSMSMANKENGQNNMNAMPMQGPTPYWKIVAERGGQMSPRQTRSATKKQRDHRPPLPSRDAAKALFDSPDAKAKQEKEEEDHEGESLYEFSFPPRQGNEDASDLTSDTRQTHRRTDSFAKDQNHGLEAAFAHIKTLENEKVDLVEQLATLRQQYQNTTEELASLQSQAGMKMEGMTLTSERIEQERKEFVEKDHQKALQIEKLKGEVLRLEEKLQYVERDQIPELKSKLESANKSVLTEHEASLSHKNHLENLQREIQNKSQEMESLQAQCKQLENEMNSLAEENEELQNQNESLEKANKNMHDEKTTLAKKLDLLETQHLSEAETKYKEAVLKLQHEQEGALRIERELESARDEAAALRMELKKNKSEWESEKSDMNVEMEGLANEMEALQEETKAKSERQSAEIKDLTIQLGSIESEYNRIKNDVLPQKEAEIETLRAEIQKQKAVESQLLSSNKALQEQIDGLEQNVNSSKSARDAISLSLDRARAELENLQTDLASKGSSNDELDKALKESLAELEAADSENNTLREKLKNQNDVFASRLQELEQLLQQERQQRQNISLDAAKTDERLLNVENQLRETIRERDEANHYMATFGDREQELHQRLMESDHVRRQLHSKVMTLMGNIRVFIRCRPMTQEERDSSTKEGNAVFRFPSQSENSNQLPSDYKKAIELIEPKKDRGGLKPRTKKHQFSFDHVFEQSQGQDEVWEATEPLVQSAVDGANVTLFAYGQTGSGKTYTMLGEDGNEGIITRSIRKIFSNKRRVESDTKGKANVQIKVELLEIYNEEVRDLLSKEKGTSKKNVRISMANQTVEGNRVTHVGSEEECMTLLEVAQSRRCVKSTASNATSSRSHLVFTIHYAVEGEGVVERKGKLNVCDLAGSERLSKSEAHFVGGALLKETQNINKSLSTLSNVIEQLQAGSKSVAYRESKLTSLLCDSLGGNSKTLAIVCVSPLESHYHESLSSLRFAEKSSKVELKAASTVTV